MRVTNNMLVMNMMRNLNNNLNRLSKYQTQLSTGKLIQAPSDDPVRASRALKLRTDLAKLEQYEKNTNNAISWLEITESAVADIGDVLQRARELTVRAANDSLTTEDKQKIASEMQQLKKQLISLGNTNYAGRYIFSGYKTDEKLFAEDGKYNIDITSSALENLPVTTYEIGVGEDVQVSTNGLDIFDFEEINPLLEKIAYGESKGTAAEKAILKSSSSFDLGFDFTSGINNDAKIDVIIDGTTYTVNSADLTVLDGSATSIDEQDILRIIKNADDGTGNKLSDVADVYFDIENKLVIKNKNYGFSSQITINFTGDTGGGLDVADLEAAFGGIVNGTTVNGTDVVETSIETSETLTDADVTNAAFEGTEILVSYNGETRRVTIGTLPTEDIDGLITALNNAFDSEFPAGSVVASKVDQGGGNYSIKFTSGNTLQDGTVPKLKIDVVRVKESTLIKDFEEVIDAMNSGNEDKIQEFLSKVDNHMHRILAVRADIGARMNRLELVSNRIEDNNITFTKLLSQNEDADMAEIIIKLKNEENVYRASLSTGAKVIQPTLIDFIR